MGWSWCLLECHQNLKQDLGNIVSICMHIFDEFFFEINLKSQVNNDEMLRDRQSCCVSSIENYGTVVVNGYHTN